MKGFTLLEVLVSMAILAIILATIYSAYTTNVEAIQIARQNGEVHQTARIVLDRMTKDLQSALIQAGEDRKEESGASQKAKLGQAGKDRKEESGSSEKIKLGLVGQQREINRRRADRIDFTTVTHLPLTERGPSSDLCEIGYLVSEDPEGKVLVLLKRDDPTADEDFTEGGSLQEIARNVIEFNLTYLDSRGEESDKWSTLEGGAESGLPALIKLRLVLGDDLGREHIFSTAIHPELAEIKKEN